MTAIKSVGNFLNHHKLSIASTASFSIPVALMVISTLSLAGISPIAIGSIATTVMGIGGGGGLIFLALIYGLIYTRKRPQRQQIEKGNQNFDPSSNTSIFDIPDSTFAIMDYQADVRDQTQDLQLKQIIESLNKIKQTKKIPTIFNETCLYISLNNMLSMLHENENNFIIFELKNFIPAGLTPAEQDDFKYLIFMNELASDSNQQLCFFYAPSHRKIMFLTKKDQSSPWSQDNQILEESTVTTRLMLKVLSFKCSNLNLPLETQDVSKI